ncbi:MAG: phospho-N-acetylmuramoyl-pentapeptide-transferase [Thermovirgaceae bacterium]
MINLDQWLFVFPGLAVFTASIALQGLWIRYCRSKDMSQTLKLYGPTRHISKKGGTPSMGGVVFLAVTLFLAAIWIITGKYSTDSLLLVWGFPMTAAAIGLLDDSLKHGRRSSEGLSSLQKLGLQVLLSLPWVAAFSRIFGLNLWPGWNIDGPVALVLLLFLFVGGTNAVNITDGLDGLAAGSCALSFAGMLFLLRPVGASGAACITGLALVAGFLWHNAHPARVFMGDVGSHFLGGLLVTICVLSEHALLIIAFGFIMGIEAFSVLIQIFAIRCLGKKIFKMSPVHHHFELAGWSETQIVTRFWLIHAVGMATVAGFLYQIFKTFSRGA